MNPKTVITDRNLLEKIQYQDSAFPISFYMDHFDEYLNGEVNHHWHDEFEFGILLKGQAECRIDQSPASGEYRILDQGDGLFINSKTIHNIKQTESGTILFNFVLSPGFFQLLPAGNTYQKNILPVIKSSLAGLFLKSENDKDRQLLNSIMEFSLLKEDSPAYELYCNELICRLWRYLISRLAEVKDISKVKSKKIQEQRIRLMLSYIHTHYGDDIAVSSIAQAANVSRSECFRCFQTVIGRTPTEYLCDYRLSQAAHMLTSTDRKISDICFACGFTSPSYFGKLFKEKCGMSPGQYRYNRTAPEIV